MNAGGGMLIVTVMMIMRIALAMTRAPMELIQIGIWTLELQITLLGS
jgi:hypothetical protein